ncbi:FxSxx-COOH system tetratricopeptide repeat protein [Streptomyces aurantiacus]|uniref:FxSxx-COOH system tetratricopeptide repeat protein n=1 Tax=Streptomyces aurantiacus TaxID=47760 RepID=UPI0006E44631|nr:FxSxx-COOH system tetratricopeptide repeat protein [Streptomyces aurantiacus]
MDGLPPERAPGAGEDGDGPQPFAPLPQERALPAAREPEPESVPHWQEIADALWLGAHWIRTGRPVVDTEPPDRSEPKDGTEPAPSPPRAPDIPLEPPGDDATTVRRRLPAPDPEGPEQVRLGPPVLPRPRSAAPGQGARSARLARALHLLARQVPSRDAVELDEETTAERGVSDELWMPWFRSADAIAFDLVILIDDAPTMRIWGEETAALSAAAEHSGAFRAVRTVKVVVPRTGEPALRWNAARTMAEPGEILNGRGDRLFLVVTDGLAHGWAKSAADRLLDRLGRAGPTAVVHLLPPHMRHRSSLYPHGAVLEAGGLGAANSCLGLGPPRNGPDPMRPLPAADGGSVPVPVLSLKAGSIAAWADLVTGERGVRRGLPVVVTGALQKGAPAPGLRAPRRPRAAAAAVRRFFTLATPAARRLATQLAAAPFEFDLIEQLRRRTMPDAGPQHVAEILMGGLIDWSGLGTERPEFAEGVREALLATTTRSQLAGVVSILGELPAAGEHGVALRAALRDPAGTTLPDPSARGWRQSELAVLRALAGPYSERARRIETETTVTSLGTSTMPGDSAGNTSSSGESPHHEHGDRSTRTGDPSEARPGMKTKTTGGPAQLVNVPLRNTSFVGRTALLRAVEEQLADQDTAAVLPHALHGMGGVGKSQLALEYIYRHQQDYNVICWIPAERESLILTALAILAAQLRIVPVSQEGGGPPPANTAVPAVIEALRTGAPYDNWLLVFDNAENVEAVRSYFPANGPGKIIVTSRNREWERVATPLPVNVFVREESVELLQKRSPDLSEGDADRLAAALGDLPLAVEQAGAWHAVTGMRVADYLDLLEQRSPEVLDLDPAPDYPVSVAAAWDISLERIKENSPGARQLIDICACMAPEPVPLSVLRGSRGIDISPEVNPILREPFKLGRAIRDLSQFSLVRLDLRSDTLQMHRLLQKVLLAKLSDEEHDRMRDAAHQLLSAVKPGLSTSPREWPAYQALLPHVLSSQAVDSTDEWTRELIYSTVMFLYYWGDYETSVDLARQAYESWLATTGEENTHVIRIAKVFAFLLRVVGEIAESIVLNERILEVCRRAAVDPEDLMDAMTQMADALRYQGRFREASEMDRGATEDLRERFGPEEPYTLTAAHSWGVSLRLRGEFREALFLDRETARLRELLFGPDNTLTLNTLNGLAIDMRECGDYPGSRDFLEDVYRRSRESLGDDNPYSLRIARNLAVCRRRDGVIDEAAKLSEETLRHLVTGYGRDYVETLWTAVDVTVDRRLMGDLMGSRELGEDTMRRLGRRLGESHAHTLVARAGLAATLRVLGDLDAAGALEDEAAERLAQTVGPHHVTTLTVALGRANTAYARLDFGRAHEVDSTALPLLRQVAGEGHPLTLACAGNLALDLRGLGRGAEADALQRSAAETLAVAVRSDHPWLLAVRQLRRIECDMAPMPL